MTNTHPYYATDLSKDEAFALARRYRFLAASLGITNPGKYLAAMPKEGLTDGIAMLRPMLEFFDGKFPDNMDSEFMELCLWGFALSYGSTSDQLALVETMIDETCLKDRSAIYRHVLAVMNDWDNHGHRGPYAAWGLECLFHFLGGYTVPYRSYLRDKKCGRPLSEFRQGRVAWLDRVQRFFLEGIKTPGLEEHRKLSQKHVLWEQNIWRNFAAC